jgi:adenine/guanine phosphoribosyltransferase-like PRPP-binding protein
MQDITKNWHDVEDFRKTNDGQYIQGAGHTCRVLNHRERNKIIIKAVCDLRKISNQFDTIACCGTSGLMVVPQVAELLDKHILIVRKDSEKRYSEFTMEGVAPFRYIILDDLICSGDTLRHINRTISREYERARCVGLYCYIPDECAYTLKNIKLFEKDYKMSLLNPYAPKG